MSPGRIRFGLVGAGGIAQAHLQAFLASQDAVLKGVADTRLDAAKALAEGAGCAAYPTYQALAEAESLDAVVVATPPISHPEISLYFVRRGIHVLCEKPLSVDTKSARTMLAAAAEARVQLTMGSKFRHTEDVVLAKSLITSGVLGEVFRVENCFTSRVNMAARWNSRPEVSGGGVLIDNGTHSADILRFIAGPIARVMAVEGSRQQDIAVEDTAHVIARGVGGTVSTFDVSWSADGAAADYLKVWGASGTLCVGWAGSRYRTATSSDWVSFGKGYNKIDGLKSQLDNFCRTIRGDATLLITSEDVLASVQVVEACYRSMNTASWVDVGGPAERRVAARKTATARPNWL